MSLSQSEGRRGSGATVQDPDGRRRKLREKLLARFESTKQVWDRLAPTVVARERSEQLKEQAAAITRRKQLRLIEEVTETGATRGLGRNSGRLLPAGLERRDLIHLLWRSVEALDLELFVGCLAELRLFSAVDFFSLKRNGDTLLHLAAFHGAEDIVHYILQHAASLEQEYAEKQAQARSHSSPRGGAAPGPALTALPPDLCAVANAIDTPYNRATPLMEAVRGPTTSLLTRTQTIDHLLAAGADVTAQDVRGDTVLHVATHPGTYRVLRHLVLRARGCAFALHKANVKGETPLRLALRMEWEMRHKAMLSSLAQHVRQQQEGKRRAPAGPTADFDDGAVSDYLAGVAAPAGSAAGQEDEGAVKLPTEPLSRRHGEALRCARLLLDLRKGGGLRRRLHAMNQAADAAFQAFADDVEESAISAAVLEEEAQHSAAAAFEQAEASRAADEAQFAERKKREATDEFDAWLRTEVGKTALRGAIEVQEARMLAAGPTGDATGAGALLTRDQHQHAVSLAKEEVLGRRLEEVHEAAVREFKEKHRGVIAWAAETPAP